MWFFDFDFYVLVAHSGVWFLNRLLFLGEMSDHLVLYVDRLVRPVVPVEPLAQHPAQPSPEPEPPADAAAAEAGPSGTAPAAEEEGEEGGGEEEPLLQMAECRICQEEDSLNTLETPCACSGSLKVHSCFYFM